MGLFNPRTDAEKERDADIKEAKKDAREDRRDARKDARDEKQDARQDARDDKKEARQEKRDEKKDAREEKRDEMKEIRQSDLEGKEKRDEKRDVRDDKRDAIDAAREGKRDEVDDAVDNKKDRIEEAKDQKENSLEQIRAAELRELAALQAPSASVFDARLALELLALTHTAQWQDAPALTGNAIVSSTLFGASQECQLRGATVRNATAISSKDFKSDTECFVARSDDGDVVVAFRGSEVSFFDQSGAFRDWALTDLRSHRMPYPPAPNSWPNQRWVHAGIWHAYDRIRNALLAEVSRQVAVPSSAKRVFVTGFSLGGALALLAALDLAEGLHSTPVELFTFAAPRVGDETLNKLVAERVARSTLVAYRGDPVVHLPPLGPNFPLNFKSPASVDLAGIHIGLGRPVIPQVGQQYRTAERLFYIDNDSAVHDRFPFAQVALRFNDHDWPPYCAALSFIKEAQRK
jgi:Lipase (class 3)